MTASNITQYLSNYKDFNYQVNWIKLDIIINDSYTEVRSKAEYAHKGEENEKKLILDGIDLELITIKMDDQELQSDDYTHDHQSLIIKSPPTKFILETVVRIDPKNNLSLMGMYQSKNIICTQCETHGFRKITYFPDRPDVMTVFTTTINASKELYPVILSNGNPIASGELEQNRHWIRWHDPIPKPCYLFAISAGNLSNLEGSFTTQSGKNIKLKIYAKEEQIDSCKFAMTSLIRAMHWDEKTYNREYDLELFNIVAVDDFNFGAMENKSLNIFNSQCVLASPKTTTDDGYERIDAIIAHEYFHNWTGNRITLKNWFQLSLKEGLTVFRDQSYTEDNYSSLSARIKQVRYIKTAQFKEDAGPMAHPVRPDSYIEMNNFYTVTVYDKGAEVIRMLKNLVGPENFANGMDHYFNKYDGQAITVEDFILAIQDHTTINLSQYNRWYTQAGTPRVMVRTEYNEKEQTLNLKCTQTCPPTPGQANKLPFMIPIKLALFSENGNKLKYHCAKQEEIGSRPNTIILTEACEIISLQQVESKPIISLLQDFSAPIICEINQSNEELLAITKYETNLYNRWEAAHRLLINDINKFIYNNEDASKIISPENIEMLRELTQDDAIDLNLITEILKLPLIDELISEHNFPILRAAQAIEQAEKQIAEELGAELKKLYFKFHNNSEYSLDNKSIAMRSIKNIALYYLSKSKVGVEMAQNQYQTANNFTDIHAAIKAIITTPSQETNELLEQFYFTWENHEIMTHNWLRLQAASPATTLTEIKKLTLHKSYNAINPNCVRALIGTFTNLNHKNFHTEDGACYNWLAEQVIDIDSFNPGLAARIVQPLTFGNRYAKPYCKLINQALKKIFSQQDKLSKNLYEVISKTLENN